MIVIYSTGAVAVIDSSYGKPNRLINLGNVRCIGSEETIENCEKTKIPEEVGRHLYKFIQVAGVSCLRVKPVNNTETPISVIKTISTVTVVKTEYINTCTISDITCNTASFAMATGKSTVSVVETNSTSSILKPKTKSMAAIQSSVIQRPNPPSANTGKQKSTIMLAALVSVLVLLAVAVVVM